MFLKVSLPCVGLAPQACITTGRNNEIRGGRKKEIQVPWAFFLSPLFLLPSCLRTELLCIRSSQHDALCPGNGAKKPCPEGMIQNKSFLFISLFISHICYSNRKMMITS